MPPPNTSSFTNVAAYYDSLMAGVPYGQWLRYLERLWKLHHLQPKSVLDLACGTGTVSRLMAAHGYGMTGVDISQAMIEVARERAVQEHLDIAFLCQDASELHIPEHKFDSVICLFDSLNYILDADRIRSVFYKVLCHLNPGGSFVFDVNTEYALAEGMFNQSCTRRDEALHYRWRSRYDKHTQICTVNMRFTHTSDTAEVVSFGEVHQQRAYYKEDLAQWLMQSGFTDIEVYDAYSFSKPHKRSDRLFFFARKGLA